MFGVKHAETTGFKLLGGSVSSSVCIMNLYHKKSIRAIYANLLVTMVTQACSSLRHSKAVKTADCLCHLRTMCFLPPSDTQTHTHTELWPVTQRMVADGGGLAFDPVFDRPTVPEWERKHWNITPSPLPSSPILSSPKLFSRCSSSSSSGLIWHTCLKHYHVEFISLPFIKYGTKEGRLL